MLSLLLPAILSASSAIAHDTVVVVPPPWVEALEPWLDYRREQGHRLEIVPANQSAEQLRSAIRRVSAEGGLRFVLLVGDARRDGRADAPGVPTHLAPARVNVRWGSEPEIATDNWYADLDDDGLPDLAIGRLTADSPAELSQMVAKILAYERAYIVGDWQRQLNFVAGIGGFGPLADTVLEGATRRLLTEQIPAEYSVSMTYASWRSPFCPDPRRFHETVVERFNEGCLFWVYLGHGERTFLDQVQVPGGAFRILDAGDVSKLNPRGKAPVAVFLACYTGAFDATRDCLAEEMLRSPDGPVAVLAGTRITMPYGMAVMGHELLEELFERRRGTLGELIMYAKRGLAEELPDGATQEDFSRRLLDSLAAALSPSRDLLLAERREHVLLFNLLGDPLLRLRHAEPAVLEIPPEAHAGTSLRVVCTTEVGGRGRFELVCRRDRWKMSPPRRTRFDPSDMALADYHLAYAAANDRRWMATELDCEPGSFEATLPIPSEARGPCHVRVMIAGEQQHALGSATVFIRRPLSPAPSGAAAPSAGSSPD